MTYLTAALRLQVERRADGRCEYCRLSQAGQEARFHIDHIVPSSFGGQTTLENLCFACVSCSLRKGAKTHALDPETGVSAPLFHPRRDEWASHFDWLDCVVHGKTPVGRATIAALCLNRALIIEIRREEKWRGRHPP
jgi:hypothetical protein